MGPLVIQNGDNQSCNDAKEAIHLDTMDLLMTCYLLKQSCSGSCLYFATRMSVQRKKHSLIHDSLVNYQVDRL